jgi:predicted small metal-binding protein
MVTIKFQTRSDKAIAWAKQLAASKKEIQKEIREHAKTPEFQKIREELLLKNEIRRNSAK